MAEGWAVQHSPSSHQQNTSWYTSLEIWRRIARRLYAYHVPRQDLLLILLLPGKEHNATEPGTVRIYTTEVSSTATLGQLR